MKRNDNELRTKTGADDLLSKFSDAKRTVANLMAKENITVQILSGAPTASFDIVHRVLTVPNWPGLTMDQTDLLIAHEIGHALFTDEQFIEAVATNRAGFRTYINVIEDARIERKMKSAFPGLPRVFYRGYRDFAENGPLFEVKGRSIKSGAKPRKIRDMKLIDRINVHYKVGAFCKVPFSAEERQWLRKIDACTDIKEAVAIAKALYKYAKENEKPEPQEPQQGAGQSQQKQNGDQSDDQNDDQKSGNGGDDTDDGENEDSDDEQQDGDDSTDGDDEQDGKGKSGDDDDDEEDEDGEGAGAGDDDEGDDESTDDGDGDGDDSESGDSDGDDSDGDADSSSSDDNDNSESQAQQGQQTKDRTNIDGDDDMAQTVKDMEEALAKLAKKADREGQIRHMLLSPVADDILRDRTLSCKEWTDKVHGYFNATPGCNGMKELASLESIWEAKYGATVKHMASEFDRKKTARELRHAITGRTGKLDMGRLYAYKYADNLFKKVTTVQTGKSHGIVALIDGSGSMQHVFSHVLDQALMFAKFAQAVGIPFEAYVFTSVRVRGAGYGYESQKPNGKFAIGLAGGGIYGILNTNVSRMEFRRQVQAVLALRESWAPTTEQVPLSATMRNALLHMPMRGLGGTPLYTGILLAERIIEKMKRSLRLEKVMFVVISDGEDSDGLVFQNTDVDATTGRISESTTVLNGPMVIRDTVTKRNYTVVETSVSYQGKTVASEPRGGKLTALLDIIRDRHNCRCIYLYLVPAVKVGDQYGRAAYIQQGINACTRAQAKMPAANEAVTVLDRDGQFVLPDGTQVGALAIMLDSAKLKLADTEFANMNADTMTQQQVAEAFIKSMKKSVSNRVFVNTVIPFLV